MKKSLLTLLTILTTTLCSTSVLAATKSAGAKFTGIDYSGVYSCTGSNAKIGNYKLLVTFTMNKLHSHGNLGRYDLSIETENSTTYSGHAIANGADMALTIEIVDGVTSTYTTGIARLKPARNKSFSYVNRYYESNQITDITQPNREKISNDIGNDGHEICVMQKPKVNPS